jgi:class 3 adenylate cyclase/tetratricopeptide (TPR) repeat protein
MGFSSFSQLEKRLRDSKPTVRELYSMFEQRKPIPDDSRGSSEIDTSAGQISWLNDVTLANLFTSHALEREEFRLVVDAAREIGRLWRRAKPDDLTELIHVRMNYAKALTRLGFTGDARSELQELIEPGFRHELGRKLKADVLVQLGHILREEALFATAKASQMSKAREALQFFRQALQVNAENVEALVLTASIALILGDTDEQLRQEAKEAARNILKLTKHREEAEVRRWRTTWGKAVAQTVLGEVDEAASSYQALAGMEGITTSDLADVRYYAQFLAEALGKPRDFFKPAFPPLQLIVFAGHLPDREGQTRLPNSSMPEVRDSLRRQLRGMGARVGLACAAAGADLLFIEAMLEMQGTLHLILPWSQDEFRRTSVRPYEPEGGPPIWEPLFERALAEAATTREIGQVYEPAGDIGWEFMMEVTGGIALQMARTMRLDIQPLVLWDELPSGAVGGTDSFHDFWDRHLKMEPIIVNTPVRTVPHRSDTNVRPSRRCEQPMLHQEVKSMMFADIVGYSKITEKAIPAFVETFLDRVSKLTANSTHAPRSVNTWGDAVCAVFDYARDAGLFALELTQMTQEGQEDWIAKGLYWEEHTAGGQIVKHPLNMRIGLHTGPVFMHYDPVVRRLGFTGAHVNRAARIEPVAKHGEVYASEEFAAMAELTGETLRLGAGSGSAAELGFICEYAGTMQLAKGYPGRHRIYRVVPKRGFELEGLAKAAHAAYCEGARARGETPATNTSLRAWEELSEDLRESNRAQVADIPNKLRLLGYELAPSHGMLPSEMVITDAHVEHLANLEHIRWMDERRRQGWTYGSPRDNARMRHPLMVPWDQLEDVHKEKDRDTIRNLPGLVEKAGFRVRRIHEPTTSR